MREANTPLWKRALKVQLRKSFLSIDVSNTNCSMKRSTNANKECLALRG
jgi:hypothetical protein